ncbi:hypothetical protein Hanom_Chr12g01114091 [Helianthus anomalus]
MDRFGDVIHLKRQLMMLFYRIFSMFRIEIGIQVYGPGRCKLRLTPLIQAILHSPLMVGHFILSHSGHIKVYCFVGVGSRSNHQKWIQTGTGRNHHFTNGSS